ncbi:MAG: restriction endonuclease subunit S [Verrucomicrobiota bacterium]
MEVKPGYKKTEVGVIPEDWGVSTVGCEFEVKLGKMLDAEKNVGVSKPYLGNKAVQWDRIDISDLPTVPMSRADIERFRLRRGDLLVCEGGEVGRAAIWDGPIEECYYQKAIHRLRPVGGFDSRVMAALLRLWSDRGQLVNYVTQTSIAHLPREKFMEVPMPVPPPMEQRAIAEALGDVDALLGALEQLIAKKRDLKQAAMQQLLTGKKRLPGFSGEWEVKKLGDVAALNRLNVVPANFPNQMFTHFSLPAFDDGKLPVIEPGAGIGSNKFRVLQGAVLVSKLNPRIPRVWAPDTIPPESIASTEFLVLTPSEGMSRQFLFVLCSSALFCEQMELAATGTTGSHQRISPSVALILKVSVPVEVEEQTAIAEVLSDMDAELAALEQRLTKTRDLKQGMMQELLTGRTRLV